jgi:hypothetical protein
MLPIRGFHESGRGIITHQFTSGMGSTRSQNSSVSTRRMPGVVRGGLRSAWSDQVRFWTPPDFSDRPFGSKSSETFVRPEAHETVEAEVRLRQGANLFLFALSRESCVSAQIPPGRMRKGTTIPPANASPRTSLPPQDRSRPVRRRGAPRSSQARSAGWGGHAALPARDNGTREVPACPRRPRSPTVMVFMLCSLPLIFEQPLCSIAAGDTGRAPRRPPSCGGRLSSRWPGGRRLVKRRPKT